MSDAARHAAAAAPEPRTGLDLVPEQPHVQLRDGADGQRTVVLAFPYDARIVAAVRGDPEPALRLGQREWSAPVDDWVGVHVADVLARFPELTPSEPVREWLAGIEARWVGNVQTTRHDGRGWWVLQHAGRPGARRRCAKARSICTATSARCSSR